MTIMTTRDLNVGDKAYADFTKYSRIDVREGTVIKKSPTGVVQIDFGTSLPYSFMANGSQRGASYYDKAQLISKDRYDRDIGRVQAQRRCVQAGEAIKTAYNIGVNVNNKTKLIEALTAALAAVEAI